MAAQLKSLFKGNNPDADQPSSSNTLSGAPHAPQPATEPLRVDKIRAFNTIISILAQIQQTTVFQDDEMLLKVPPTPEERIRLKLSNAFAHLAIANNGVVAATLYTPQALSVMVWTELSDDQGQAIQDTEKEAESNKAESTLWDKVCWLFACNTTHDDMKEKSTYRDRPAIVKANKPKDYPTDGSPEDNLRRYLEGFFKDPRAVDEESHLWILATILVTLRNSDTQLVYFLKYVIAASYPKINRRFHTPSAKDHWRRFKSLKQEVICLGDVQRNRDPIELENDRKFLKRLEKVFPDYRKKYPKITGVLDGLPEESPQNRGTTAYYYTTIFELFNADTCKEYHKLFTDLMDDYMKLIGQVKEGTPLNDRLVHVGHAILTMVKGRAFYLYLSSIVVHLSKDVPLSKIELDEAEGTNEDASDPLKVQVLPKNNLDEAEQTNEDASNLTALWNDDEDGAMWKPFKSWVMLMLVQLDAADALCAFVKQAQLTCAEIDVHIVYSPLIDLPVFKLKDLLTQPMYIPEAPMPNPRTNAKLLDFITTALKLKSQAESAQKYTHTWGKQTNPPGVVRKFLQDVLNETKKEHEEDKMQRNEVALSNQTIAGLSNEIKALISDPKHKDSVGVIIAKFGELAQELEQRQKNYDLPFNEVKGFRGALHCEAALASILNKSTREDILARINAGTIEGKDPLLQLLKESEKFTRVIGISKRCCPVCRCFLSYLSIEGNPPTPGFVTPGFHNTITNCTLPEWTPDVLVNAMNRTFGLILRKQLENIADKVLLRPCRSRRQSSGSGVSVGNGNTIVGDIVDI